MTSVTIIIIVTFGMRPFCPTQLMIQLALMGFVEYVLHLTRMNPDQMYLHQDCGYLSIAYFKFHVDDVSGTI